MNKKKGIISLILTVVLIGLLGFTTIVGFGGARIGASQLRISNLVWIWQVV